MKKIILILIAALCTTVGTAQSSPTIGAAQMSKSGGPDSQIVNAVYCQGEATTFSFSASGFNADNVFYLQMSDANGSFASPTTLGSVAGSSGFITIPVVIPVNTPPGTAYGFIVVTSSPMDSYGMSFDNTINAASTYYADADNDGFGNAAVTEFKCAPSAGFVTNSSDCNDSSAAMHQMFPYYVDGDGDGIGTGSLTMACGVNAGTAPAGYSTTNSDCNDANAAVKGMYFFYADNDGDGFGAGPIVTVCAGGPSTPPAGYAMSNSDCNDANPATHQAFPFYVDADGDGYGTGFLTTVCAVNGVTPPAGYATVNGDCNDGNAAVHQIFFFFVDTDGDGYGAGSPVSLCAVNASTPPAGYAVINGDCNDNNAFMHQQYPFYVDADGDSFGTGGPVAVCAVNSLTPPTGYATNNADCNDSNGTMHFTYFFYVDADHDGHGTGNLVSACAVNSTTPPVGYSLNNTDCNDANANVFQMGTFFVDADNDGYTTGSTAEVCYGNTTPTGYTLTNIGMDCNDFIAAIHLGAPEVLFNGVDDNCDGVLDEGQQLYTQIIPTQCGTTLATMGSTIYAVNHNGGTMYRFEVTNTSTGAIQILERPLRWFTLTMLAAHDYATTYSIRVELQRNGIWLGYYGPSCLVSSPAILEEGGAQVGEAQCGITLPTIQSIIFTNNIGNATGYRFRITNLSDSSAPNQVQTLDRPIRWFSLTMLATYNYGTTYMIEVAVKTNGQYSDYGAPCLISTGPVPSLSNCSQVVATSNTMVTTQSMHKATSYRFQLTNLSTGIITTITRPLHWFKFNMIPGYAPGQQYDVQVSVMTSGSYSLFGDTCTITAPGAAKSADIKEEVLPEVALKAIAYPNPYSDTFSIDLTDDGQQEIAVMVYDMMGKLLETRRVPADELQSHRLGSNCPAGVYNVVVSQGDLVKTLRIIKR